MGGSNLCFGAQHNYNRSSGHGYDNSASSTPLLDKMKQESKRNIVVQGLESGVTSAVKGIRNTIGNAFLTVGKTLGVVTSPIETIKHPIKAGHGIVQPVVKVALKPFQQVGRAGKALWLTDSKRAAKYELSKLDKESLGKNVRGESAYEMVKADVPYEVSRNTYQIKKAMSDADMRYGEYPTLSGKAGVEALKDYYSNEANNRESVNLHEIRNKQLKAMENVAEQASLGTKLFKRKALKSAMKEAAAKVENVQLNP